MGRLIFVFLCEVRVVIVCCCLFTKPSSIWHPLSQESYHPASIHQHCPVAQCRRILSKFTCPKAGRNAVEDFKARYFNSFLVPVSEPKSKPNLPYVATSWLVLPYNVCLLLGGLRKVVASLVTPDCVSFRRVRLSWSLGSKHLVHELRRQE